MATKNPTTLPRVELLHVFVPAGLSGRLAKHGQHSFTYDTSVIESEDRTAEISLTMPLSAESYNTTRMLPVFQTFLPEGYLRERIQDRFAKVLRVEKRGAGIAVEIERGGRRQFVEGSDLLIAAGRSASVTGAKSRRWS